MNATKSFGQMTSEELYSRERECCDAILASSIEARSIAMAVSNETVTRFVPTADQLDDAMTVMQYEAERDAIRLFAQVAKLYDSNGHPIIPRADDAEWAAL